MFKSLFFITDICFAAVFFRCEMEKQILGKINGNPTGWNSQCYASQVIYSYILFSADDLHVTLLTSLRHPAVTLWSQDTGELQKSFWNHLEPKCVSLSFSYQCN